MGLMFGGIRSIFDAFDAGSSEAQQDGDADQQPQGRNAPDQAQSREQQQAGGVLAQASELRALWDQGGATDGGAAAGGENARGSASGATSQAQGQGQGQGQTQGKQNRRQGQGEVQVEEDPEDRTERRAEERQNDLTKELQAASELVTIAEAVSYCRLLIEKQLERADNQHAQPNASIYGDAQARQAITTLLPDEDIRTLFLHTTQQQKAWPRLRSLFGVPPYNFLRPEDAGIVRAAGIARGRTNMAYEDGGQIANYSQFGSGHYVDSFEREYRVVSQRTLRGADTLPYDLENIEPATFVHMNVRVPKRSRIQKNELLKDQSKRRAVLFPYVGEELVVEYSRGLRSVWRSEKASGSSKARVVVKSMTPRSATASTASVVVVRV